MPWNFSIMRDMKRKSTYMQSPHIVLDFRGIGTAVQVGLAVFAAMASLQAATVERMFRPERYSRGDTNVRVQQPIDEAAWVWRAGCDQWGGAVFSDTRTDPATLAKMPQSFFRFRRDFTASDEPLEFDVSADERFVLLLDGVEVARGPMRGLPNRWHYQSYRVTDLKPGAHCLEAVCWQVGEHAPLAQISIRGGFILKASGGYDAQLTTGKAAWKVAPLVGTRMTHKGKSGAFGVGSQCEVRGTGLLDETPDAALWADAVVVRGPVKTWAGLTVQGWKLFPSPLKDMMRETKTPGAVKRGFDVLKPGAVVPANAKVTAWWDLGNYYCAYPRLAVLGGKGAKVCWDWAECLTGPDGKKGDRAAFGDGLDMPRPFGDTFLPDGRAGANFTTPWWRCGRWCRLTVETADEPLTIGKVEIVETRYPVEMAASFACDDPFVMKMQPVCARALQMCMHEMFFDCPYYEQQMYPGDSRVQYLVSGLFDTEDRMVRNAITLYDTDRRENGMIPMNCPTRGTQDALGFTCCEAMMFGDYAWNHTNRAWLKARLPGLNHTLMGMEDFLNADGLLGKTPGWNFVDWVPSWQYGVPPDGDAESPNAEMNLQYLHAILSAAIAEDAVGDATLAAHWRARAGRLRESIRKTFWCADKALFASNVGKTEFSEHSQCLALLADVVTGEDAARCFRALTEAPDLARGTIYYKHYLFTTFFKFRRADLFFKNLGFWKDCLDWHLSTILEVPNINSRSDCHGWGSHPLWHLHTGVAGVRSAAPFYGKVVVEPQPAHLKRIRSVTPTPKGDVKLDLSFDGGKVSGTVTLPDGLPGVFRWNGTDQPLSSGRNAIR